MLQWVETQYSAHSGGQLELLNNLKSFPHKSVLFAEQSATHEERVLKSTYGISAIYSGDKQCLQLHKHVPRITHGPKIKLHLIFLLHM